jgi:hypothetical protein
MWSLPHGLPISLAYYPSKIEESSSTPCRQFFYCGILVLTSEDIEQTDPIVSFALGPKPREGRRRDD